MSGVNKPSAAFAAMNEEWAIITALLSGTTGMRKAQQKYLPKWPNEDQGGYDFRLSTATLFPAYSRTVQILAGKPFSHPTVVEGLSARLTEWSKDIDLQGRDLQTFIAAQCQTAIGYGLAGILVDYPVAGQLTAKSAAEERAAGTRPYFVEIPPTSLLGYRSVRENGGEVFTQLRFMETVVEEDGEFGESVIDQVRVLYPGAWEIYRKSPAQDVWVLHSSGLTSLNKIPFVPLYGDRLSFMRARSPLMELAHLNVEHWQSKSDQQTILHVARVPILFGRNLGDTPIVVSAATAIQADDEHADLRFVEHSGKAIAAGRDSLHDLEDQMRQIGAELLIKKPGHITNDQTQMDSEPGTCVLQRIVQDAENAFDKALGLMAEWVGETYTGHVSIYQDFGLSSLAEASAELLLKMKVANALSSETLLAELKRRSILGPNVDIPEEVARAKAEAVTEEVAIRNNV